ncbi:helix-turn-helix domain-containing protein [Corallococcus sicarius]|uniref:Helix-turn-helix domain-containing protein n=1 Tax=Corallococcus sicarius TaxID=2316726 RepID=A0A3A8MS20_9BACT|nr:helix-turn-helix domain-containing protein [Corallococcus sicarius]RKH34826.1 helix-turn-helix domain-containing protein [Corallococcus sicarius]
MRPGPPDPRDASFNLQGLARRIRTLRERRGLTQEEFAERCAISVSFVSLLERGERNPSYDTLLQVAAALELPLWELFRLEDAQDAGAHRLVEWVRVRGLGRADVDRLLAVADVMFSGSPGAATPAAREPMPASCTAPDCGRPVLARGWCTAHYHRARRKKAPSQGTPPGSEGAP